MSLPPEDQVGLARLLDEWSIRDALTVLDEVSRRIKVVEALEKLMSDKGVDELQVLHPLVTQARWLFGPEYDSLQYSSNSGLRSAVLKVFGESKSDVAFSNARQRPDLLVRADSTVSAVATEEVDADTSIVTFRRVLLVELKRGGFTITTKEMNQASGYCEDLMTCGLLDGKPHIQAFVVGHSVDPKMALVRKLGDPETAKVNAVSFSQLVRTANGRLFKLRDSVEHRYPDSSAGLLKRLMDPAETTQLGLGY
jgi:hypothetical protein